MILFTDPDDITGQRMIPMDEFLNKIEKTTELPFFFDGVVVNKNDKEMFDYMFTKEEEEKQ